MTAISLISSTNNKYRDEIIQSVKNGKEPFISPMRLNIMACLITEFEETKVMLLLVN